MNSPHKWPVTQKMFPFDDVIMETFAPYRNDFEVMSPCIVSTFAFVAVALRDYTVWSHEEKKLFWDVTKIGTATNLLQFVRWTFAVQIWCVRAVTCAEFTTSHNFHLSYDST